MAGKTDNVETWTVDSDASGLVINEILADNLSYEHEVIQIL